MADLTPEVLAAEFDAAANAFDKDVRDHGGDLDIGCRDTLRGCADRVRTMLAPAHAALAAERDKLAKQLAAAEEDYQDLHDRLDAWPQCPDGCGCDLATGDPDARECACGGPCTMECRENGYPDAPSYRDLAVKAERERIHRMALDLRATFTSVSGKVLPFEELIRRSPEENAALLLGVVKDHQALDGGHDV